MLWAILAFVLGALVNLVGRSLIVDAIVRRWGGNRFASADSFEGCSSGLTSGILTGVITLLHQTPVRHPTPLHDSLIVVFATPLLVLIGSVIYSLIWLYNAGRTLHEKEFLIEDGRILRASDREELFPLYVTRSYTFVQSDAFHGDTRPALDLHGQDGERIGNGYPSEEEFEADFEAVLEIASCFIVSWRTMKSEGDPEVSLPK